jgi:hypothetical protein
VLERLFAKPHSPSGLEPHVRDAVTPCGIPGYIHSPYLEVVVPSLRKMLIRSAVAFETLDIVLALPKRIPAIMARTCTKASLTRETIQQI